MAVKKTATAKVKKEVTAKVKKEVTSKVLNFFIKEIEKSDEEILRENAQDNLEILINECETQINILQYQKINPNKHNLKQLEKQLKRLKSKETKVYSNISDPSYANYLLRITEFKTEIAALEAKIIANKTETLNLEGMKKEHENILKILTATE